MSTFIGNTFNIARYILHNKHNSLHLWNIDVRVLQISQDTENILCSETPTQLVQIIYVRDVFSL